MGRLGGALLTIVGTVVGAYFGVPQLGALIGGLAGALLFPTQLPTVSGPRLADIAQTVSNVGAPIPRGWGTFPAAGCVIAQTDLREVIQSEEVGGKGAPSQTVETPTYFQDFAIGVNDGLIAGIRTIWANGKPIYDRRPQRADESDESYQARNAASDQLAGQMVIYLGTETQEPDPTLEAFYGIGEISAFRGLAYVVFVNWQNKPEDGNRMPAQWKFEVFEDGSASATDTTKYSNEQLFPWLSHDNPINSANVHVFHPSTTGNNAYPIPGPSFIDYATLDEALGVLASARGDGREYSFYLGAKNTVIDNPPGIGGVPFTGDRVRIFLHYSSHAAASVLPGTPGSLCGILLDEPWRYHRVAFDDITGGAVGQRHLPEDGLGHPPMWDTEEYCSGPQYDVALDGAVWCERVPRAPPDPCAVGTPIPGVDDWVIYNGELVRCGGWTLQATANCLVLAAYAHGDVDDHVTQYPLSPARPPGHAQYLDQAFWTDAYNSAVARGQMPAGMVYQAGGATLTNQFPKKQNFIYASDQSVTAIETLPAQVSRIVRDLCLEAGLTESDIDVTELAPLTVMGYVRARVMAARSAIEPLRQACFFDGVESERKLKFRRRGAAIAHVFEDDDLGAMARGEDRPSRVTTRKLQDVDLPRSVRAHYLSQSRDYESGQQDSPARTGTEAVNDLDVELPIVLTDDQALQIAQVLWADAWASRWLHNFVVDAARQELEPADCVGLPVDGRVQRVRLMSITDALPAVRKMESVRDDDGSYVSYAVASVPPFVPRPLTAFLPAEAILLDLPLLRDEDNDPGFYLAARSSIAGNFKGAALYRSLDGGGNYGRTATVANEALTGTSLNDLPAGPSDIIDEGNSLLVEMRLGTLDSISDADLLNGQNGVAVGADGRWEILQFRDAELLAPNIYRLTGLLRGRRGTEHNIGLSIAGDAFVFLAGVVRVPLQIAGVGREYLYKIVATGTTVDSAVAQAFTGRGVALKPFSPATLAAELETGVGDWTVTWLRRGRIGQTLQSGTDIALSEESEAFEIDVLDGVDVVRTIDSATESATYTAAQQVVDFGTVQSHLSVVVYQVSASVGRGYGAAGEFEGVP